MAEYAAAGNGDAEATKRQAKYAYRYMDLYLATRDMDSFAELLARKDPNLTNEDFWRQLATWMALFAKQLNNQSKGLNAETALKMLSALTKAAKGATKDHALWASGAWNSWYTEIRTYIEKTCDRRDIIEGDADEEETQEIGQEQLAEIVATLNKKSMGDADHLTRAFALVLTFHCVGRPGEFVYTSLDKVFYDSERETVLLTWSEMKKLSQYKIPLCVGRKKELCPLWAMSGYFLSGAFSSGGGGKFIFSKQAKTPDAAQGYLNGAVKGAMFNVVEREQVQYFTGKSLRRGGVGHLVGAPALRHDLLPAVAMGNWQIPCRITEYFSENAREAKRAIATRSLAGHPYPYTKVVPPRFVWNEEFAPHKALFANLVAHGYAEHWAEFGAGQRLAKVGEMLLTVELMYLPDIVAESEWGKREIAAGTLAVLPRRVGNLLDQAVEAGLGEALRVVRWKLFDFLLRQGKLIMAQYLRDNAVQAMEVARDGPPAGTFDALATQYAELHAQNVALEKVCDLCTLIPPPIAASPFPQRLASQATVMASQAIAIQQLTLAVQQLHGTVAELARGRSDGQAAPSPLGRSRKAAAAAAAAVAAAAAARSPPREGLVPSNADGADDTGYFVPPTHPLAQFIIDIVTKGLGVIKGKEISWQWGQWRVLSQTRKDDKAIVDRNNEARKITELFLYLATDAQLQAITAALPATNRTAALASRKQAAEDVVANMMDTYLPEHERYLPQKGVVAKKGRKAAPRSPNCGALYRRWKIVGYAKGRPINKPAEGRGRVDYTFPWVQARAVLDAPQPPRAKRSAAAPAAGGSAKRGRK